MRSFALLIAGLGLALVQQGCLKKDKPTEQNTTADKAFLTTKVGVETHHGLKLDHELGTQTGGSKSGNNVVDSLAKFMNSKGKKNGNKRGFLETKLDMEMENPVGEKQEAPLVAH
jgi:hypothetical protein